MGRLDFGSGRFDADFETREIAETLRGWQSEFGDRVLYYRYWGYEIEVLHVTHVEGGNEDRTQYGQYYNDNIYLTASFEQLKRLGMTELDLQHQTYLNDRLVYDFRVFRVTRLQVMGQIQRRDVIVSIEGTQVKPDEMANDVQFEAFANPQFPERP
jgi:hypothetical protein